jgi:hypothetical protein
MTSNSKAKYNINMNLYTSLSTKPKDTTATKAKKPLIGSISTEKPQVANVQITTGITTTSSGTIKPNPNSFRQTGVIGTKYKTSKNSRNIYLIFSSEILK